MPALGARVRDQGWIGNYRRSRWCDDCKAKVSSTCPHVRMTSRQRRRMAEREQPDQ